MPTEYDADIDSTTLPPPRRTSDKLTSSKTSSIGSKEKDVHFRSSLPRQPTSAFNSIAFHRKSEADYSSSSDDNDDSGDGDESIDDIDCSGKEETVIMDLRNRHLDSSMYDNMDASLISLAGARGESSLHSMPKHWKDASSSSAAAAASIASSYNPSRNVNTKQKSNLDMEDIYPVAFGGRRNRTGRRRGNSAGDDGSTPRGRLTALHRNSSSSFNSSSSDPTSSATKGVINESERARRTLRNLMTRGSSRLSTTDASPGLAESFSSLTVDGGNRRWSELGDFNNSDGNIIKHSSSSNDASKEGATNKLHVAGQRKSRTLLQVWTKRCAYTTLIVLTGLVAYYIVTYEYDPNNGILDILPNLHSASSSPSDERRDHDERELMEPNSLIMTALDARVSVLEQQVGLMTSFEQEAASNDDDEIKNYASTRLEQQYARVQARKMQRRRERATHRMARRAVP